MGVVRINELPEGSGSVTNDDLFVFMDDPSGSAITKKVSLTSLNSLTEVSISATGTINNWNPSLADVIFASGSGIITGLDSSYSKDVLLLYNIGASSSGNITLKHSNTGSLEDNRFLCPYNLDYVLEPENNSVLILRDKINNKWRIS